MSRGTKLQEMEQSKTAVNANATPGDTAMPSAGSNASGVTVDGNSAQVEDLGGPTPQNYKPDDDSAKLKEPGATLKQVADVITKNAAKADAMPTGNATPGTLSQGDEVEIEDSQEVVSEDQSEEATEEAIVDESINIEDDVNALLGGEELSEEFKERAKTIFEAALNSKIKEIQETLEIQYEQKLNEEKEELKVSLQERVDSYLEYVAEEWMTENQLAIEHGLKTEMTESFLSGMKGLFEEHYVTIPEDKYDVLESMVEKLDDMETKLNEQIDKNIGLNKRLGESVATGILESVSDGLAATQKEKLASLAESVEFESEQKYREKLEVLKESYFEQLMSLLKKSLKHKPFLRV
jgi:SHS2 domain-containing protein